MATDLDQLVEDFRHRPLGPAPRARSSPVDRRDALTMKVREGGRVVNALVLLVTGINGDGHRDALGRRGAATAEPAPPGASSSPTSSLAT